MIAVSYTAKYTDPTGVETNLHVQSFPALLKELANIGLSLCSVTSVFAYSPDGTAIRLH